MPDDVFSRVKVALSSPQATEILRARYKPNKLIKTDPELKRLVAELAGVPVSTLEDRKVWTAVYEEVKRVVRNRHGGVGTPQGSMSVNTLANAVFFALYEAHGKKASELAYAMFEPLVAPALSGGDPSEARLLFEPVTGDNLARVVTLLKKLLAEHRRTLCAKKVADALGLLCVTSAYLDRALSARCTELVSQSIREVCRDGSG